ncbi:MAG TPA: thioredoxin family protein [Pirellulales bacterium]
MRAARWVVLGLPLLAAVMVHPAFAQLDLGALNPSGKAAPAGNAGPVTVTARIAPASDSGPAQLVVTADVAPGWHIYSLTQKPGGPVKSKITVEPSTDVKLAGEFKSATAPDIHPEPAFDNLPVEAHEGRVVWTAPLELSSGADAAKLSITGKLGFQACDAKSCMPPKSLPFTAAPVEAAQAVSAEAASAPGDAGVYKPKNAHVVLQGYLEPKVVAPGEKARLVITAEPAEGYHVYALAARDPQNISKPTLIVFQETAGWQASPPVAQGKLVEKPSPVTPGEKERYYEQPVTWMISLAIPRDAKPGIAKLSGLIGLQTCKADQCDMPHGVQFEVEVPIEAQSIAGKLPLVFRPAKSYKQAADAAAAISTATVESPAGPGDAFNLEEIEANTEQADTSLFVMLGAALLGGLILNCMPCVLPVIGLKLLGFVEQSHQSRHSIFLLNVWFTLGLMSVFAVLASLAVFLNMGWGEQFTKPWFTIGMSGLVFAMALSFLGVWEIPIPGFVGSGTAGQLATQEGAVGAFAKGVFTTLLATPCSGPFLGPLFGLLLRQPPAVIYAIFLCVGLGMASPYLLIGAFPRLIHFLPKPGVWMDTFKQAMAFVLLGTVVFLFMSIKPDYLVPTFALLIGIWLGCWWAGRTPLTAELGQKVVAWGVGAGMATFVGLFAFNWLVPGDDVLPWQPFSQEALVQLSTEGKTVFVDFTAEWCLTCKTNERVAINTRAVRELVEEYQIVPLKADWTDGSAEIKEMLHLLGRNSIPVYAIFPASQPNKPIVFSDLVTQGEVLEKLREAGPSRGTEERTALKTSR